MKVAKVIKSLKGGPNKCGDGMILYEVNPPMSTRDRWDTQKSKETKFVVLSTAGVPFSGIETYIFPADAEGKIESFAEMDGSMREVDNHEEIFKNLGYVIDKSRE